LITELESPPCSCHSYNRPHDSPATRSGAAGPDPWWFALAAFAALAALGALCAVLYRHNRRLASELRAARIESHGLVDVLDVWHWQSDGAHRLRHVRPPRGSVPSAWSTSSSGSLLLDQFRPNDLDAARACIDAHGPLDDVKAPADLARRRSGCVSIEGCCAHR
jgi:hypothetical protein